MMSWGCCYCRMLQKCGNCPVAITNVQGILSLIYWRGTRVTNITKSVELSQRHYYHGLDSLVILAT